MATVGLRDLYFATVTEAAETGIETFGSPTRLAKLVSAKMVTTRADGSLVADDAIDQQVSEFASCKLTLEVNDLKDEDTATLLGAELDATSKVVYSGLDDDPPYVAIGFRAKKPGGKFRYVWLYKGKFAMPSEEFATGGEKVEFKTPTIEGTFQTLSKNGKWKADMTALPTDTVAAAWFTTVQDKAAI